MSCRRSVGRGKSAVLPSVVGAHCAHFCTVGSPAEWSFLASFEMQSAKAVAKAERVSGVAISCTTSGIPEREL